MKSFVPAETPPLSTVMTVYVVEDDELLRNLFCAVLSADGLSVEAFAEATSFLKLQTLRRPCCLVLDLRMPRIGGIEVLQVLRARGSRVPAIVVTGYGDVDSAVQAMKAGAADFIEKPVRSDRPIELVRGCLADDANDNRIELSRDVLRSRHASLTARECDVMERVVTGASNKVIARELGVSPRTVEHHRANVMKKMDCGSLAELIRTAALLTQADA